MRIENTKVRYFCIAVSYDNPHRRQQDPPADLSVYSQSTIVMITLCTLYKIANLARNIHTNCQTTPFSKLSDTATFYSKIARTFYILVIYYAKKILYKVKTKKNKKI